MRLAVMQPYFFPYLGYFQLINAVDKFLFFNDVDFITNGWINRNQIQLNQKKHRFTVPLNKASQNKQINEITLAQEQFLQWKQQFKNTLFHAYGKTSYYKQVMQMIEEVLDSENNNIGDLASNSVRAVCHYLDLEINTGETANEHYDRNSSGQNKILQLCQLKGATEYINLPGGQQYYNDKAFKNAGIELKFIRPQQQVSQFSVLDTLFLNSKENVKHKLKQYELIKPDGHE